MYVIAHVRSGGGVTLPWSGHYIFLGRHTGSLQTLSSHELLVFLHMGSKDGFAGSIKEGVALSPLLLASATYF